MRADARRRRDTLIHAARDVFVERGHDAPLDAIAARADVGIATLYRNFPSREELAHAVAETTLSEVGALARDALARFDADPTTAWTQYIDSVVELRMGALVPAIIRSSLDELPPHVLDVREETKTSVSELVFRAQHSGLVREDLDPLEIVLALATITRPLVPFAEAPHPNFTRRLVAIYLAGIRPGAADLPD
ncbi:TetR/AcrR family transcriptional regulator [Rhodococcus sp. NPDC058521]|uniref:TetR/AcrR family transcriptional regulator n=1 Tax=Rhodococcus sp. NPDC058521 TaxID=3346536 RepID=UPI0036647931